MKLPDDIEVICHCGKKMDMVMGSDNEGLYMCEDQIMNWPLHGETNSKEASDILHKLGAHYGQINITLKVK